MSGRRLAPGAPRLPSSRSLSSSWSPHAPSPRDLPDFHARNAVAESDARTVMDSPEQNVAAQTELPKPAALQDKRPSETAAYGTSGTAVFDAKNVSLYYGSF